MTHLYQFKWMGILPSNITEEIHIDEEMSLYLLEMMQRNRKLFLMFDDVVGSPSDPHIELFHSDGVYFHKEICYLVNQNTLFLLH